MLNSVERGKAYREDKLPVMSYDLRFLRQNREGQKERDLMKSLDKFIK